MSDTLTASKRATTRKRNLRKKTKKEKKIIPMKEVMVVEDGEKDDDIDSGVPISMSKKKNKKFELVNLLVIKIEHINKVMHVKDEKYVELAGNPVETNVVCYLLSALPVYCTYLTIFIHKGPGPLLDEISPQGILLVPHGADDNCVVVGSHVIGNRLRASSAIDDREVDLLLHEKTRIHRMENQGKKDHYEDILGRQN
ncbi:hypothetical protein FXO38_11307 [Capsicum annuum]|nr:hypothetical protein FXO38_11307 [Capsicum annuum]